MKDKPMGSKTIYKISAYKNVRLITKNIEANSPEQAVEIYVSEIKNNKIDDEDKIESCQWYTFSNGDCDVSEVSHA